MQLFANRSWAGIFLFLWFLVYALLPLTPITFVGSNIVLGVLAVLIVSRWRSGSK